MDCRANFLFGLHREHLENVFNETMAEYFMNFKRHPDDEDIEWRWVFIMDDDKVRKEYGNARDVPFGEESHLKHVRHVKRNRHGFNNHVVSYTATDIPVLCKFERVQHTTELDTFNDIMKDLFNVKGSSKPNLAGRATLLIDREYFKQAILRWWLETGGG